MQTQAYSSPSLKSAGAIIDMTDAAHIDRNSPEPGTTFDPMSGGISLMSPEPGNTAGLEISFHSPEPGNTVL